MKFSRSSRILGAALAVGSICLAMPQEVSQDNQQLSAPRVGEVPYETSPYEDTQYSETAYEGSPEEPSPYEQPREKPSYEEPPYQQPPREKLSYGHTPYGRDPAASIIEWEVGSPALYAARSVDDPDTCPKGTGIYLSLSSFPCPLHFQCTPSYSTLPSQNHHADSPSSQYPATSPATGTAAQNQCPAAAQAAAPKASTASTPPWGSAAPAARSFAAECV
ncbi:uncharacterized protein BDZ83DRAFT_173665 [Colletotrichum acutatum]|uniref:Uncharacterized protein n=1 Tax=Glomerella acutata TaxID=27357 RepID=A0AAD8UAT2_GLOAC|nr:uncharacterized protein BDZ83DRAFT_173665 [Colletotrichum acutatum]KAK1707942.1 hypothetical protein BDZ83DRAFT_173665 [Colletotrichum acutatum]